MLRAIGILSLVVGCAACEGSPRSDSPPFVQQPACTQVVLLKHASAAGVAATLDELLAASAQVVRERYRCRGCAMPLPGMEAEMWNGSGWAPPREARTVADPRTNSLVVTAPDEWTLARLVELITRLDDDG